MSDEVEAPSALLTPDALQTMDNMLRDMPLHQCTRRSLLKAAVAGAAGVGFLGSAATALAGSRTSGAIGAPGVLGVDDPVKVASAAITAEALANVYLAEAINRAPGTPAAAFTPILQAAGAAEYDHYHALTTTPGKPLTMQFWIPDAAYGKMANDFFNVVEKLETLFINAYLIGITSFSAAAAKLGSAKMAAGTNGKMQDTFLTYARFAGEILGTEGEHRVLARYAASKTGGSSPSGVPNNKGLETFTIHDIDGIVSAIEGLGVGFGKQGATPGKFYTFSGTKPTQFSSILANFPA